MKPISRFIRLGVGCAVLLQTLSGTAQSNFWSWASRPPMGWNSWDFYGTSINEACTKAQTDYLATNLQSHGWGLITVDIQWYQPTASGFGYISGAALTMDQYGRLTPATNRFPSAMSGQDSSHWRIMCMPKA